MVSPRSGREVANQYIVDCPGKTYFQSYSTVIALKKGGKVYLDKQAWNYSKTTGKYRNEFLGESKKETERKIKQGIYKLTNLNK
jgi:hypothetical protein